MNPFEFRQLLRRYRLGKTVANETQRLETWYDTLGASEEQPIGATENQQVRQRMWQQINAEISGKTLVVPIPFYRQNWFRVAATVLLLMGLFGYGLWTWPTERTGRVVLMSVRMNNTKLPMLVRLNDGSQVTLQPGSFLRFPEQFSGVKREVFLTGSAFFNVSRQPERPFLVVTDRVVTKVLGTSFWVNAFGGKANVSVTVRTGKVSVFSRPASVSPSQELSNAVVLVPNQRAVFYTSDARLVKTLAENPLLLTPENQRPSFDFVDTPLPEVFQRLEKAYGVDFVFDAEAIARCTLTAKLGAESLYEKLALISEVTRAHYEIIDGQVVIDSQDCLPTPKKPTP